MKTGGSRAVGIGLGSVYLLAPLLTPTLRLAREPACQGGIFGRERNTFCSVPAQGSCQELAVHCYRTSGRAWPGHPCSRLKSWGESPACSQCAPGLCLIEQPASMLFIAEPPRPKPPCSSASDLLGRVHHRRQRMESPPSPTHSFLRDSSRQSLKR